MKLKPVKFDGIHVYMYQRIHKSISANIDITTYYKCHEKLMSGLNNNTVVRILWILDNCVKL